MYSSQLRTERYWLLKSEPSTYSIADLQREKTTLWDGVRNYQARNFLREMAIGDRAFFYHSNTKPPGIAGLARVIESEIIDPTQFDPESPYFDPKATPDAPRWQTVKLDYLETFPNYLSLATLKATFRPDELLVVKPGNRLSVTPIATAIARQLLAMGRELDAI